MLDTLILRVKEEIAIDGPTGSRLESVWKYVQTTLTSIANDSGVPIIPTVDDKYKSFIWNYIRSEDGLEFYENVLEAPTVTESQTEQDSMMETVKEVKGETIDISEVDTNKRGKNKALLLSQILEEDNSTNKGKKRAAPITKKKAPPAKKKKPEPKSKKKPIKKEFVGDSDDDFVEGSADEHSESEFEVEVIPAEESDIEEHESEEEENKLKKKVPDRFSKKADDNKESTKVELSKISDISELDYEQVIKKYGNSLYIVGSAELQEAQLFIGALPGASLSPDLSIVLKEIIKTRHKGVYQAQITHALDIDSRSTGHFVKSLEERGFIMRNSVSINGCATNLCIHRRFCNRNQDVAMDSDDDNRTLPYNVSMSGQAYSQKRIRDAMVDLAKDAPGQTVFAVDILSALGFDLKRKATRKWFNRVIEELCFKGYFRKSNAKNPHSKGNRRCIHLIKIPDDEKAMIEAQLNTTSTIEEIHYPILITSTKNNAPITRFLVNAVLEQQCFGVLKAGGDNGITQRDFSFALNINVRRTLSRALERMVEIKGVGLEHFGACRHIEFEGKQRRYRYFTYTAFKKRIHNIDVELSPLPESDLENLDLLEVDQSIQAPHTKKALNKSLAIIKGASGRKNILSATASKIKAKGTGKPSTHAKAITAGTIDENMEANVATNNNSTGTSALNLLSDKAPKKRSRQPKTPIAHQDNEPSRKKGKHKQTPVEVIEIYDDDIPSSTPAVAEITPTESLSETLVQTEASNTELDTPTINKDSAQISTPNTDVLAADSTESTKALQTSISTEKPTTKGTKGTNRKETEQSQVPAGYLRKKTIVDYFAKTPKNKHVPEATTSEPKETAVDKVTSKDASTITNNKAQQKTPNSHIINPVPPIKAALRGYTQQDVEPMSIDVKTSQPSVEPAESSVRSTKKTGKRANTVSEPTDELANEPESSTSVVAIVEPSVESSTLTPSESSLATTTPSTYQARKAASQRVYSNAKGMKIIRHITTNQQLNIYYEARINVIRAMLEETPICELSKEFRLAYLEKAKEMFPQHVNPSICNKSLWRSACGLAEKGEAVTQSVKYQLVNGRASQRRIIVRKDIDLEGDYYKGFINNLKERRTIQTIRVKPAFIETVDVPVERLEQRIDRLKKEMEDYVGIKNFAKARKLRDTIETLSFNLDNFANTGAGLPPRPWYITAIQYGWVNAKMARAKLLHQLLVGLIFKEPSVEGVSKDDHIVSTKALISSMSVSLICQIIGVGSPSGAVSEYIRKPENGDLTILEIPDDVRFALFSDENKFRRKLFSLISLLEYIEVIKPNEQHSIPAGVDKSDSANSLHSSYYICETVIMKDRYRKGQPPIRQYSINSISDFMLFWSELQFLCTDYTDLSEEEREPVPEDPLERAHFNGLFIKRCWSVASVYTREQRRVLNSFIDKENKTTPWSNTVLCRDIAEEFTIPLVSVQRYYEKAQFALNRKEESEQLKAISKTIAPVRKKRRTRTKFGFYNTRRIINLDSARAFTKYRSNRTQRIIAAPTSTDEADQPATDSEQNKFLSNLDNLPVVSSVYDRLHVARAPRNKWDSQSDELLLYCHIIMRHRAKERFYWKVIQKVLPGRTSSGCRARLAKLFEMSTVTEQYDYSVKMWAKFYTQGMDSGAITDPDPYDMLDFDLLGYLSYFIQRLSEDDIIAVAYVLPKNVKELYDNFNINNENTENSYNFENMYHERTALAGKAQILTSHVFTTRRWNFDIYDTIDDALEKEEEESYRTQCLIRSYIIMIAFTPSERFDPFFAYAILHEFPPDIYQNVLKTMKAEGMLCDSKGDRNIPGTRLSISAKFSKGMEGALPYGLFSQAVEYEKFLNGNPGKNRYSAVAASDGMMACILFLLSENNLRITMANRDTQIKKLQKVHVSSRLIDNSSIAFDTDVEKLASDKAKPNEIVPHEYNFTIVKKSKLNAALAEVVRYQNDHYSELIHHIVEHLNGKKESGSTLYEIRCTVDDKYNNDDIVKVIDTLCHSEPTLICPVGFGSRRYILVTYSEYWLINNKSRPNRYLTDKLRETAQNRHSFENIDNLSKKELLPPYIWTDISGSTTSVVFKSCAESIINFLLSRPGATTAVIASHYANLLHRVEIQSMLDVLTKQSILKRVQVVQDPKLQMKSSIFAKSPKLVCSDKSSIGKLVQSCYWVTSSYYHFLI